MDETLAEHDRCPEASPIVDEQAEPTAPGPESDPGSRGGWAAVLRALVLVATLVGLFVLGRANGLPDIAALRAEVDSAGRVGWLVFVGGYAVLALLPAPKGALTALGGLLFGWWTGAALSLVAALLGAVVAHELGRWLGRDAVDRLVRGRLARLEALLRDHGLGAVVTVRLIPVLPYTAINYGAGVVGVRRRDFALGSAVGMVPGSLSYAALGAWGANPWVLFGWSAVAVVLGAGGVVLGRRVVTRGADGASDQGAPEHRQDGDVA